MNESDHKIIIIGAGLTGLSLAYLLNKRGIGYHVLEARDRLGGRIHTIYKHDNAPLEMGATWLGKKHNHLNLLLDELEIQTFVQELSAKAIYEPISTSPPQLVSLPPNEDPSFRIKDGSSHLINQLADQLDPQQITLSKAVRSVSFNDKKFRISTDKNTYHSEFVVSTLPPNLLVNNISFSPDLPEEVTTLCKATHTWMGESIKVALGFSEAFWKEESSATMFSNVGPISELYDHSDYEGNRFALKGFMNGAFYGASKEERKNFTLNQLSKYYGEKVKDIVSYEDCAWKNEQYTFMEYDGYILPHQNNGDKAFRDDFFEGKFFLAGSETAPSHPGYMEGAVESANFVFEKIIKKIN